MSCCKSCSQGNSCESKNINSRVISSVYDSKNKTFVSVRDGWQEYATSDYKDILDSFGTDVSTPTLRVYRSPETIKAIADSIRNIPITDGHVETLNSDGSIPQAPKNKVIVERIDNSNLESFVDVDTDTTTTIKHKIQLNKDIVKLLDEGVRELSLGYNCKHRKHGKYVIEQYDIQPHHLAVVEMGRCGSVCSIKDSLKSQTKGENGMTLEEAMKEIEKLKTQIAEFKESQKDGNKSVKDSADFKLAVQEATKSVKDEAIASYKSSEDFKAVIDSAVQEKVEVVKKASEFLSVVDSNKSVLEIQKEVLAQERPSLSFTDAEVGIAFKMLEKQSVEQVMSTSDSADDISSLKDKEY